MNNKNVSVCIITTIKFHSIFKSVFLSLVPNDFTYLAHTPWFMDKILEKSKTCEWIRITWLRHCDWGRQTNSIVRFPHFRCVNQRFKFWCQCDYKLWRFEHNLILRFEIVFKITFHVILKWNTTSYEIKRKKTSHNGTAKRKCAIFFLFSTIKVIRTMVKVNWNNGRDQRKVFYSYTNKTAVIWSFGYAP